MIPVPQGPNGLCGSVDEAAHGAACEKENGSSSRSFQAIKWTNINAAESSIGILDSHRNQGTGSHFIGDGGLLLRRT